MLVIDSAVRAAHARRDLNAGMRYAVVRLAELLDPGTPFVLSGCAYCDPIAATAAFASAAGDFQANPGVRFGTVLAASQLLSDALAQEGNLRAWYAGDLTRLQLFLAQLRKVPAIKTVGDRQHRVPYHERTTWVRQKLDALTRGSLARFREAIEDPETGYRARLLAQLARRLRAAPAGEREWAELEHDLCYLSALLLGDGRDGRELARAMGRAVAGSAGGDDAVRRLAAVVLAAPSTFQVALVLAGTASLRPEPPAGLGVSVLDRERPGWTVAAPPRAGRALAAFLAERAPAGECTPLLVCVQASDAEQARACAQLAGEAVRDHLVAAHPGAWFCLRPEALVLDAAAGTARVAGAPARPLREGRVPRYDNAAELLPFLRANALARAETSPVLRVLHTWIALEYLARDGAPPPEESSERPGLSLKLESYLPPHLASVAALAGLRALLLASWDEVRALALRSPLRADWMAVEKRLGVAGGRPRSLSGLVSLVRELGAVPAGPAAALLHDVAAGLGPFPLRRLETLGRQFDSGSRLAKVAEAVQVRTLIAVARLKLARHLAVHRGFDAAHATPPLALSAVQVLDSAFEVLQRWMRPGCRASEAMAEARSWHERNLSGWRSGGDLVLDADHLLHPQKQ